MMHLSKLLKLQWVYVGLGIGYNVVSYMAGFSGGRQLSTTNPISGILAMMMFGAFLLAAH